MIRLLRDFRLVPIVLFATITLFVLKTMGLLIDGRYALGEGDSADITGTMPGAPAAKAPPPNAASNSKQSWAQQVFNYPDVTGAAGDSKPVEAKEAPKPALFRLPSRRSRRRIDGRGCGGRWGGVTRAATRHRYSSTNALI